MLVAYLTHRLHYCVDFVEAGTCSSGKNRMARFTQNYVPYPYTLRIGRIRIKHRPADRGHPGIILGQAQPRHAMGFRFVCQLRLLAFSSFQSPGSTLTEFTVRLGENPEEGLRFGTTVGLQLVRLPSCCWCYCCHQWASLRLRANDPGLCAAPLAAPTRTI